MENDNTNKRELRALIMAERGHYVSLLMNHNIDTSILTMHCWDEPIINWFDFLISITIVVYKDCKSIYILFVVIICIRGYQI